MEVKDKRSRVFTALYVEVKKDSSFALVNYIGEDIQVRDVFLVRESYDRLHLGIAVDLIGTTVRTKINEDPLSTNRYITRLFMRAYNEEKGLSIEPGLVYWGVVGTVKKYGIYGRLVQE